MCLFEVGANSRLGDYSNIKYGNLNLLWYLLNTRYYKSHKEVQQDLELQDFAHDVSLGSGMVRVVPTMCGLIIVLFFGALLTNAIYVFFTRFTYTTSNLIICFSYVCNFVCQQVTCSRSFNFVLFCFFLFWLKGM